MEAKEQKLAQVDNLIVELGLSQDEVIVNLILSQDKVKNFISAKKSEVTNYVEAILESFFERSICELTIEDCASTSCFIGQIEEDYSICIPEDATKNWKTVEDIVETVSKLWAINDYCAHLSI